MSEQQYPDTWEGLAKDAQPGVTLTGEIVDGRKGQSDYGDFDIIDVKREDGTVFSVPAFHTVLKNQLKHAEDRGELAIGAKITFQFLGTEQGQNGRKYRNYKVNGGGGSTRRPSWVQREQSADPPIQPEPVAVGVPAQSEQDDDNLPFLWRPNEDGQLRQTNYNPFGC